MINTKKAESKGEIQIMKDERLAKVTWEAIKTKGH